MEMCHYVLIIHIQESQLLSFWLVELEGESRQGFKAGPTLTSSESMYLDKEPAHGGHQDTSN